MYRYFEHSILKSHECGGVLTYLLKVVKNMFDYFLQLAIATIMVLLTLAVQAMVCVLVNMVLLAINAMNVLVDILGSLPVNLVSVIQMGLLTSTVMLMVSVLVKLTILDKNAINIDVLDGKS